jgi:hypothetical protein
VRSSRCLSSSGKQIRCGATLQSAAEAVDALVSASIPESTIRDAVEEAGTFGVENPVSFSPLLLPAGAFCGLPVVGSR